VTSRIARGRRAPVRLIAALTLVTAMTATATTATATAVPAAAAAPSRGAGSPGAAGTAQPPDPYYPELGNRGYDVDHYDVGIAYDPSSQRIDGDTLIEATATERLRTLNLDFVGMDVTSISVDGKPAKHRRVGPELIVRPRTPIKADKDFEVRVQYSGSPQPSELAGIGLPNGWLPTDDGVVTLNEPDGARTVFPVNDHPTDKASYTFRLDVPKPLTAVANGDLESREDHGDRTTFVWDAPAPMASYLSQLAIGNLVIEDAEVVDGVTIRHAFAPGIRDAAAAAAAQTPEMLRYFTQWFGKFPFATYGVLAPDGGLRGLAFEAQTFSIFAPDIFASETQASAILAHEMAHQWFGDWVSPASWADTWLNEGFATYAEWLWGDATGEVALALNAQSAHQRAAAEPDTAAIDPGREGMFSGAVYDRGALTLHALRLTVGDEPFAKILRTYLERYGGDTASTEDLVAVASKVSGSDMTDFFASWLGPGEPPPLPAGDTGSVPPTTV
jgi:aminopeptidase N